MYGQPITLDPCESNPCPAGTRCVPIEAPPGSAPAFRCDPVTVECAPCPPGSEPCTWAVGQDLIQGPTKSDDGRCYAVFCHPAVGVAPRVAPSAPAPAPSSCGCTYTVEVPCDWKPPVIVDGKGGGTDKPKPTACPAGRMRLPVVGCVPKWVPWVVGGVVVLAVGYYVFRKD